MLNFITRQARVRARSKMKQCNLNIPRVRYIGRIFVFFHILRNHRLENGINFIIGSMHFLLTGYSKKLGWYYHNYKLFKVENSSQIENIHEIFNYATYDVQINKSDSNTTIVDIGGFLGDSAVYFSEKCPKANLFVFEPHQAIFKLLQLNVSHNISNRNRVNLFNKAVVAKISGHNSYLYSPSESAPQSTLFSENLSGKTNVEKNRVDRITFEEVIKLTGKIDLLKIDAEGTEYELLPLVYKYSKYISNFAIELHYNNSDAIKLHKLYHLIGLLSKKYRIITSPGYFYHKYPVKQKIWREFLVGDKNIFDELMLYGSKWE